METPSDDRDALGSQEGDQAHHGWDERHLARLAHAQDGVVALAQLTDLGLTRDARITRIRQHRLVTLHRGVYIVGGGEVGERGRCRAAALACRSGALVSDLAAARLLDLWERPLAEVHVTVPRPRSPRHRGIVVHQTGVLMPADATHVRGIPCTSVTRTIADLAATRTPKVVEVVFELAERRRLIRPAEFDDLLRRRPRAPGTEVLRGLLETHRPHSGTTRSILERRLLSALRRRGVSEPVVNGKLQLGDLTIEPDLMWREPRLVVELDGGTHADRRARRRDARRDREALRQGWIPLRFTWDDVDQDVRAVVRDIRDALGRR